MKKWLYFFLFPGALFALPLNNPAISELTCDGVFFSCGYGAPMVTCDTMSVRIGYYGDFIFNNYMEVDRDDRGSIRLTRIYTNGGEIDFNFWDKLEVFGMLGVGNVCVQAPISNFSIAGSPVNSLLEIDTVSDFAWSVGARGAFWECGRFRFGVEGQYYRTCLPINYISDHFRTTPSYVDDIDFIYQSWQVALGTTYEICINACFSFLPYVSIAYSGGRADMGNAQVALTDQNNTIELFNLKKERYFGYGFGGTLAGGERLLITAEGRFAYEKALFISMQMRL
ncbi:MAG: Major outer membrane porin [Chlamydiales bacterium]|nr:Major outer membrane porin [Chlamydiales bacterium]MCH9635325.1 Major outer membrane porin [Chlamydiales bacterium]MCH9703498.1 hypothetical protein [Chlamydiota bacterium]